MNENKSNLKFSLIILLGILTILLTGTFIFKIDIVLLLVLSIIYTSCVAKFIGISQKDILNYMAYGTVNAFSGLLFFILIGAIIGIFIESGTVPTIVYYGLDILSPKFFLPTTLVICSLLSSIIGSSWSTVGTVGIAILGIASASNIAIPLPIIAGAIVSGAWFGDKMSPVSDSTVMSATAVSTNVYKHIKAMSLTTIPTYILVFFIYLGINLFYDASYIDLNNIKEIKSSLDSIYNISFINFIPLLALIVFSILKVDAIVSLLSTIGIAIICSIITQGSSLQECFSSIMNGFSIQTDNEKINHLLNRGGINSMMPTFLLCFFAVSLGGILEKGGFLTVIIYRVMPKLKSTFSLIFMTMSTAFLGTALFADIYLSIILNANMYKEEFDKRGLSRSMLSRTIEEGTTLFAPLIPWTAASIFITTTLGIPTTQYLWFTFLNLLNPLISLICTFFGIFIIREKVELRESLANN